MSQLALAKLLGTSHSSVVRYENGTRIPEAEMMTTIWVTTHGAVDPNSFHRLPEVQTTFSMRRPALVAA